MKRDLEQRILELQEEFDFAEPNMGHFERFQAKLKKEKKLKPIIIILLVMTRINGLLLFTDMVKLL